MMANTTIWCKGVDRHYQIKEYEDNAPTEASVCQHWEIVSNVGCCGLVDCGCPSPPEYDGDMVIDVVIVIQYLLGIRAWAN